MGNKFRQDVRQYIIHFVTAWGLICWSLLFWFFEIKNSHVCYDIPCPAYSMAVLTIIGCCSFPAIAVGFFARILEGIVNIYVILSIIYPLSFIVQGFVYYYIGKGIAFLVVPRKKLENDEICTEKLEPQQEN